MNYACPLCAHLLYGSYRSRKHMFKLSVDLLEKLKKIVFGAYEKMFGVHLYYFLRNPDKLPTCILLRNVIKKINKEYVFRIES